MDIVLSIIGFLIVAAFEPSTRAAGKRELGRLGIKANWYVELLAGMLLWVLLGIGLLIVGAALLMCLSYFR